MRLFFLLPSGTAPGMSFHSIWIQIWFKRKGQHYRENEQFTRPVWGSQMKWHRKKSRSVHAGALKNLEGKKSSLCQFLVSSLPQTHFSAEDEKVTNEHRVRFSRQQRWMRRLHTCKKAGRSGFRRRDDVGNSTLRAKGKEASIQRFFAVDNNGHMLQGHAKREHEIFWPKLSSQDHLPPSSQD